jgi:hypothetical protein
MDLADVLSHVDIRSTAYRGSRALTGIQLTLFQVCKKEWREERSKSYAALARGIIGFKINLNSA